jgi:hypothetical protein
MQPLVYFFKFMQPLTYCISSNSYILSHIFTIKLLYIVKQKGGKPDRIAYPLPYGLRNIHRNLKSENSPDYAQKPQQNCRFINLASGLSYLIHRQFL